MTDRFAGPARRRQQVRRLLAAQALDLLVVTAAPNVRFLTGFSGTNGTVVIDRDADRDVLITDARYEQRARHEAGPLAIELTHDILGPVLARTRGRIGVEAEHLSWSQAQRWQQRCAATNTEVIATRHVVESVRLVKDADEVAAIRQACALTAEALRTLVEGLAPGMTERAIAQQLEDSFRAMGADGIGFPSIVASGPNGAVPHHAPTQRVIEVGDLVTIDCGAVIDGYHADCTRTVAVGKPTDKLAHLHAVVVQAQQAGTEAARAGASCGTVDHAARSLIAAAGFGDSFIHGTGHGVGLQIHEAPSVSQSATATLHPGMVITVEPGIYVPGVGGIRIEDTLVVTEHGPERLTELPRGLLVV